MRMNYILKYLQVTKVIWLIYFKTEGVRVHRIEAVLIYFCPSWDRIRIAAHEHARYHAESRWLPARTASIARWVLLWVLRATGGTLFCVETVMCSSRTRGRSSGATSPVLPPLDVVSSHHTRVLRENDGTRATPRHARAAPQVLVFSKAVEMQPGRHSAGYSQCKVYH
jgi:hypothetical protein